MTTTVTGKLTQDASQFKAGEETTGFGLRLGVKYFDRDLKADAWTNYECAIFAKSQAQIDLYAKTLVKGAVVELSADKVRVRVFNGANGAQHSIELLDAKLGYF
jgi:single-strand DNA-binding protein